MPEPAVGTRMAEAAPATPSSKYRSMTGYAARAGRGQGDGWPKCPSPATSNHRDERSGPRRQTPPPVSVPGPARACTNPAGSYTGHSSTFGRRVVSAADTQSDDLAQTRRRVLPAANTRPSAGRVCADTYLEGAVLR